MKTIIEKSSVVSMSNDGHIAISAIETPDQTARMAFALIERWGAVAAEADGEDSTGRAKLKLQSPADLVKRAFDIAEAAIAEAKKRGLTINVEVMMDLLHD